MRIRTSVFSASDKLAMIISLAVYDDGVKYCC